MSSIFGTRLMSDSILAFLNLSISPKQIQIGYSFKDKDNNNSEQLDLSPLFFLSAVVAWQSHSEEQHSLLLLPQT